MLVFGMLRGRGIGNLRQSLFLLVQNEIDVLRIVSNAFAEAKIEYMLSGSMALNHYTVPRMTRDLDIVVHLTEIGLKNLFLLLRDRFYFDQDVAKDALRRRSMFNIIHDQSAIKVDLILRKNSEYRQLEFERRKLIRIADFDTYIASIEDLVLSKLLWAKDSLSDFQLRDVRALLDEKVDLVYIERWVTKLDLELVFEKAKKK